MLLFIRRHTILPRYPYILRNDDEYKIYACKKSLSRVDAWYIPAHACYKERGGVRASRTLIGRRNETVRGRTVLDVSFWRLLMNAVSLNQWRIGTSEPIVYVIYSRCGPVEISHRFAIQFCARLHCPELFVSLYLLRSDIMLLNDRLWCHLIDVPSYLDKS